MQEPRDGIDGVGVVLLVGPSGCGKTHLARTAGLPIVSLDDFYRDGTEVAMPRLDNGIVDWEDPASWDLDVAAGALAGLCRDGSVEVPTYAFGEDRVVGHRRIDLGEAPVVLAEGIFAGELIARLRTEGLLVDALLIQQPRAVTFLRRLLRDLREGRKNRWYLLRQGWAKTVAEADVVARQRAQGARPTSKAAARRRLAALAHPDVAPGVSTAGIGRHRR